jgi:hypothetical protein
MRGNTIGGVEIDWGEKKKMTARPVRKVEGLASNTDAGEDNSK